MSIPNDKSTEKNESTVTPQERDIIDEAFINDGTSRDNKNLQVSELDKTDADGELLNEQSGADGLSANGLDIPGANDDDADESLGEEDEENNGYSQADTE